VNRSVIYTPQGGATEGNAADDTFLVIRGVDLAAWSLLEDPDIDGMETVFFGIRINKRFQRHSTG
jgi:hypothetical protein